AVFLVSDESTQVTGVELNCDAGRSMPGLGTAFPTNPAGPSQPARGA
ncbi:MAG: hypothetical protein HY332_16575, partial [Chloroflexi bacterium]|nr:hypothetical protein [Chloroflexota bacterium]